MPELPEVQTTVSYLHKYLPSYTIVDVWSDLYLKTKDKQKDTLKNKKYFLFFKKQIYGKKILGVSRRGKNILIKLGNEDTILVHMKMTGHLLFGEYSKTKKGWFPTDIKSQLSNPKSRFVHVVFTLKGKDGKVKHLALSDVRKFAKITLIHKKDFDSSLHLINLGYEILDKSFTLEKFKKSLFKKPNAYIKTALMDQSLFTGIGAIYSDELLWLSGIKPNRKVSGLTSKEVSKMFLHMKPLLRQGINLGGDSMIDYRRPDGTPGKFQNTHKAYKRKRLPCSQKGCGGVIIREVVDGRGAYFCPNHQK